MGSILRLGNIILFISLFQLCIAFDVKPYTCGPIEAPEVPPLGSNYQGMTLKQVTLIFRHGDRLMYQDSLCWPNDQAVYNCSIRYLDHPSVVQQQNEIDPSVLFRKKYMRGRNYYAGNCETGQLTDIGYLQEHNVGQMYKKVYVDSGFLPSSFDPSSTYLRSDESDRCIQSLQSILLGMYPGEPSTGEVPIYDINTMDSFYDNIAPNGNLCPLYTQYLKNASRSAEVISHWNTVTAPLLAKLSAALGTNSNDWGDLQQLHDCLVVHECHEQPVPSGVTREMFAQLNAEYSYYYNLSYSYPNRETNAQAGIGYLLQEVIEDFILPATTGNSPYKLLLFSGHDTTLLPILAAFDLWEGIVWAHYASQMQLELYEKNSSFYIRLVYNGIAFTIPGCPDELCDWNIFYSIVTRLYPLPNQCQPSYYYYGY